VKRTIIGAAVLALGLAGLGTSYAGTADGQGAQKRGLYLQSGSATSECESHTPATDESANGFVILNAPGKVGATDQVIGEVSLKKATPDTTFMVFLAQSGMCTNAGSLTTNGQGNGNAHIDGMGAGGEYYVVLQDTMMNERYASAPATVI
jgi:hypothetical protein